MNTYYNVEKWNIQTWNTGSSLWQSATSWPRGSSSTFSKRYESTMQFIDLADGSVGAFTPSTHQNIQPFTLTWNRRTTTSTFRTNLKTYITDKTGIKISFHDSTTMQGYLVSFEEVYDFSGSTQQYTVVSEFRPFSVDGNAITS